MHEDGSFSKAAVQYGARQKSKLGVALLVCGGEMQK
jgi:hypothetical protein